MPNIGPVGGVGFQRLCVIASGFSVAFRSEPQAGSSDLIRCSNGNAEARVPSSRASTNVNTHIFEGSPGPQGPARLQKRTQTHLARLHSGTQMFSTRGPVFVYCDYTQSGAQSAQPPHPGAFAPNVSPAHSTASAHNLRFLFCWGGVPLNLKFWGPRDQILRSGP